MIKYYALVGLFVSLLVACSNNLNTDTKLSAYRADANRYCKLHSLTYWKSIGKLDTLNKMEPYEKANTFSKAFRESIKTTEMQEIIFKQGKQVNIRKYYTFLQKNIPILTQEPFECPAVAEFYSSN